MAHYYITDTHWVYKSHGARKVKKIYPFFRRNLAMLVDYTLQDASLPRVLVPMARRKFPILYRSEIMGMSPSGRWYHVKKYHPPRNKTIIPLTSLKDGGSIIFHSNDFSEIMFELSSHQLNFKPT